MAATMKGAISHILLLQEGLEFFYRSFSISNSLTCFCSFFTSYVELKSAFPCPGNALSPYSSYSLIQRRRLQPLIPNSVAVCVTDLSDSCASFTVAILNCLSYTARFIIWTAFLLLFSFCPVYYTPSSSLSCLPSFYHFMMERRRFFIPPSRRGGKASGYFRSAAEKNQAHPDAARPARLRPESKKDAGRRIGILLQMFTGERRREI